MISVSPFYDVPEITLEALGAAAEQRIREISELATGLKRIRRKPIKRPRRPSMRWRSVRCLETGKTYKCIADAARAVGVWPNAIRATMGRKIRRSGVLHFEFV